MTPGISMFGTWAAVIGCVVWLGWSTLSPAAGELLVGQATVIDADTLEIQDKRVRLHGVDAPERQQNCYINGQAWPCGRHASLELAEWLGEKTVVCRRRAPDSYGRMVASCYRRIDDVGAWLTVNGWAVAATKYSHSYVDEQETARRERRGIWQSDFVMPWDYRNGERVEGRSR